MAVFPEEAEGGGAGHQPSSVLSTGAWWIARSLPATLGGTAAAPRQRSRHCSGCWSLHRGELDVAYRPSQTFMLADAKTEQLTTWAIPPILHKDCLHPFPQAGACAASGWGPPVLNVPLNSHHLHCCNVNRTLLFNRSLVFILFLFLHLIIFFCYYIIRLLPVWIIINNETSHLILSRDEWQ